MMVFLMILINTLITFIFLNLYSRYLAKELKKIEDRVLVYLQLKTMLQKDSPSSVKE
nr:MAG TPA: Anaphase promoting complex subunit 8 / Cdc23 [Caudoviricetes sp.]